jgi:hypothetical protein
MRKFILVMLAVQLAGCASRALAPVAVVEPQYRYLVAKGGSVDGLLSEKSSDSPTSSGKASAVNGQITLAFTGSGADYFTGDALGPQSDNGVRVTFQTKTTKACNYQFDRPEARGPREAG